MAERYVYPFTAIVGQERMRLALLLHGVNPALGGVLIRGEKGTAKSTAVRALANLLPGYPAVQHCPYGCDPNDDSKCDDCAERCARGERLPVAIRPVPVVELPIGATEDRVLGSLDLETAIQSGERRFEPGLLARANRGILYVDEVNLLGDHLVDVLLDAAAMGRNYVEREGISFSHPASFMLIGTMNPEEGDLRPQLLDRFALVAEVEGLHEPADRAEVVRRRIAFESDPAGFVRAQEPAEDAERQRLARARALLPAVRVPDEMLDLIVRVCAEFEVDGMRADLAIYRAAMALAAYDGRGEVGADDVRLAAELALPHRRRRRPFEQAGIDHEQLDRVFDEAANHNPKRGQDDTTPGDNGGSTPQANDGAEPDDSASPGQEPVRAAGRPPTPDRVAAPGASPSLSLPVIRNQRGRIAETTGRRSETERGRSGANAGIRTSGHDKPELAVAATLRAAAPHQRARRRPGMGPGITVRQEDLRQRLRKGRSGALVLFIVDASGSMGARDRMATTKGAVLSLLLDAYRKRDRVGLISFRDNGAELLLPPTNSVDLAERSLRVLPTGGRTPLAIGLALGSATIERALRGSSASHGPAPLLVLVSDGRANNEPGGGDPWQAALSEAGRIRERGWTALVLDPERGKAGAGLARTLSSAMGAKYLPLDSINGGTA